MQQTMTNERVLAAHGVWAKAVVQRKALWPEQCRLESNAHNFFRGWTNRVGEVLILKEWERGTDEKKVKSAKTMLPKHLALMEKSSAKITRNQAACEKFERKSLRVLKRTDKALAALVAVENQEGVSWESYRAED